MDGGSPLELGGQTDCKGNTQGSIEALKAVHGKTHPAETGKKA
jgi:hypothetical protein